MGTNTQTADTRVKVVTITAPGLYAAQVFEISSDGGANHITVRAANLPGVIDQLQNALIDLTTQAQVDKAGVAAPSADDAQLLADLKSEVPVTLSAPAFSGAITEAIASSGIYSMIWETLNDEDSPTWDQLADSTLLAIIRDYEHTVVNPDLLGLALIDIGSSRESLLFAAKGIFVGRAAEIEAAAPKDPAAGGDA